MWPAYRPTVEASSCRSRYWRALDLCGCSAERDPHPVRVFARSPRTAPSGGLLIHAVSGPRAIESPACTWIPCTEILEQLGLKPCLLTRGI